MHGTFSIGLMRLWPTKVDQHAVADVAGDEAVELPDGGGDAGLVAADHLAQVLGIEPR